MTRLLTATIFLITLGLAFAQPPVDYTLVCDVEGDTSVVGAASLVDGKLHVALDETVDASWTCDGTLRVEQDEDGTMTVRIDFDASGKPMVTLETMAEGDVDLSGDAQTLPEEAIAGMVGAQENRAMAAGHRADAEAETARERAEAAPEDVEEEASELLPETPDEDDAPEVSGSAGAAVDVNGAAEGRP